MMTMMNSNDLLILVAINDGDLVPVVAPLHVSFILGEIGCEKNWGPVDVKNLGNYEVYDDEGGGDEGDGDHDIADKYVVI